MTPARAPLTAGRVADAFVVPRFIPDFLCSYVRARGLRPRSVLGLWAAAGWMLPALVEGLAPARAIGVLARGCRRELVERFDPEGRIEWRWAPERDVVAAIEPGLDVVVGCPPWPWQPRYQTVDTADGPLVLTEDDANVALLEACARLAGDGVGLFVVGPGFVMRPGSGTAMANLGRFRLSVELLAELPRGIFSPDSGSGRLLIGIGRAGQRAPLVGSLTPDGQRTASLLEAVGRQWEAAGALRQQSAHARQRPGGEAPA